VTQVRDLEGVVTHVICAEYRADGSCRLKNAANQGGPLSQLLEQMAEDGVGNRGTACVMGLV
jgi:hypothetical protein